MFMRLVSPSYHHMNLQNLLIILVHFLVAHHRSAVQFFLLPSEILTDLMRTKPNDIFAPSRHPRRPEPVVKKLFPASKALLLDGIVVLILEVSQSWPTAVAHGDSEFSPVYTLLVTCHLSTPRFFPTHKFYPAAMHSPPCSLQQTMDDTAVTAISAAPLNFTHSNIAQCDSKQLQPVRCFLAADAGGHCAQLLRILPVSLSTMCPHSIKPFSRTFLCTAHAFVAISVGSVASWNGYESLALL